MMDTANIITLSTFVVGFAATVYTIYKNTKAKRAEFLLGIYKQFEQYGNILVKIDDAITGKLEKFASKEDEKELEGLLGFFDSIFYLFENKMITKKEAEYFLVELRMLKKCKAVENQVKNIHGGAIAGIHEEIQKKMTKDLRPYTGYNELNKVFFGDDK